MWHGRELPTFVYLLPDAPCIACPQYYPRAMWPSIRQLSRGATWGAVGLGGVLFMIQVRAEVTNKQQIPGGLGPSPWRGGATAAV